MSKEKAPLLINENPRIQQQFPPADPEPFNPANHAGVPPENPPAYDAIQVGYQPPNLPQQPVNAQPNVYTGHRPQPQSAINTESDKYLIIAAIIAVVSLVLSSFTNLICTVPLIICAVSALQAKDQDKRLYWSKFSVCGGIYALICAFSIIVFIGAIYGIAFALNSSNDENY